ncbi:MAG: hypothetical protein U9N76_08585, partial [Candidatus Marinimicrobia bacterium]|nr:hypothetical protein [Candidatus Neomarinimicrobiota bacterium]
SNEIEIKIRSLTNIEETDTLNNVDTFAVENYWINENSSLEFNLEDSIFNSVKITPIEDEYKIYIKPENVNFDLSNFNANLTNSHALKIVTEDKIDLQIKLDKNNISVDTTNFISWISLDSNKFYCQKISNNSGDQYFDIDKAGYYIFAESDDNIAPKIEININGRKLLTDSYVSNNSRGTAFITDNNGVNPLNDYWKILIDDEEISQTNVSVLQGENIKELGLSFNLELEKGNHTLQIMASDIVGNETYSDRYQIKYITDAKIIDYGNYPNPFSIRTMLIYELTEQFEELEINIYTISGKKIFTINQYNSETDILINNIGYHEITWNGRDRYNNFVANGVYFYEIKGIINNSVKKTHGKIVKLR